MGKSSGLIWILALTDVHSGEAKGKATRLAPTKLMTEGEAVTDGQHMSQNAASFHLNSSSHSYYSPDGDVICTSLDDCKPWDQDAWKQANNDCALTVAYSGPGLHGVPKTIKVFYDDDLDGGGTVMAMSFVDAVKNYLNKHGGLERNGKGLAPFHRGHEWCTGPGFIAFAQLAAGLVSRLLLSDINPKAVKCLHKTVEHNKLQGIVDIYLSKDYVHVPVPKDDLDKLDVVWGNPPNYLNIDPKSGWARQLRPADPGWKTHKVFYENIRPFLKMNALLMIEEVMPDKKAVTYKDVQEFKPGNYDTRTTVPLEDFQKMAARAGFKFLGMEPLAIWDHISQLLLFEAVSLPVPERVSPLRSLFSSHLCVTISVLLAAMGVGALFAIKAWKSKVSV